MLEEVNETTEQEDIVTEEQIGNDYPVVEQEVEEPVEEPVAVIEQKPKKSKQEKKTSSANVFAPVFTRLELLDAAESRFKVKRAVVAGAMRMKGKDMMTIEETFDAITDFLKAPAVKRSR